ncbi:MAG: 4Fe-4S dicluster domain-containing protein [Pseudomonadota bacterium]
MAILTDVTKCIGCEECVSACRTTNETGEDRLWRWQKNINDLSASRWTTIVGLPDNRYVRQQCRHCLDPACVSACPVGALSRNPEGPVTYNSTICMGCRYCMMACPFAIPRYLWSEPIHYVRKCVMCYEKIKTGELKEPACTKACPTKATIFGNRDELIEEAHRLISEGKGKYLDKVWGEKEVGGTAVLYVSDVSLDFLAWQKDLGNKPLPEATWKALKKVPGVFVGVGAAMVGIYWVIERRQKRAEEKDKGGDGEKESEKEKEESAGEK